ncbi:MAG TPA: DUF488 domain-containing protein [Candidatus Binatia bacterium]
MTPGAPTIHTVGHSTRSLDELVALLRAHGVTAVADVRTVPRSRRHPHFCADSLAIALPEHGIEYLSLRSLGGLRRPRPDSINGAWRNDSFRGYADFMQTDAFIEALEELTSIAREKPTATMCAEAVPWRCHRSLISDALVVRGWRVLDIMSQTKAAAHSLTKFALVDGTTVTYPPEQPDLLPV